MIHNRDDPVWCMPTPGTLRGNPWNFPTLFTFNTVHTAVYMHIFRTRSVNFWERAPQMLQTDPGYAWQPSCIRQKQIYFQPKSSNLVVDPIQSSWWTNDGDVRFWEPLTCWNFTLFLFFLSSIFIFMSSQCCSYALVIFRHKSHLVMVRKTSCFGLK